MIGPTMNAVLEGWNKMDPEMAAQEVLPCCGSQAWASRLASRRPLRDPAEVLTASDEVWWKLHQNDWREAFETHPRIGERKALATERSLGWSDREQSAAISSQSDAERLAEGNRAYEAKFGRTFIVSAMGKDASAILDILHHRLNNDAELEMREAAAQQCLITGLRLRRWMGVE